MLNLFHWLIANSGSLPFGTVKFEYIILLYVSLRALKKQHTSQYLSIYSVSMVFKDVCVLLVNDAETE